MKNLVKISLGFIVALWSVAASAQELDPKDPKAMSLLEKAYKAVSAEKGYAVKFTIEVKNNQSGKKESMKGSIDMFGEKFKLSVSGIDTYFDGKIESVYMADNNEVTISEPDAEQLKSINPISILRSYKEGYKMQYIGTDKAPTGQIEIVDLFPEDLKSPYARITLSFDAKTLMPVCINTQGKNGVSTMVKIDEMKGAMFNASDFVFDTNKYKDIEIIDLR